MTLAFISIQSSAQCYKWAARATTTSASTCAANATIATIVTGPDAVNLSNLQYGITIASNGFSAPLQSSPNFTGVPSGYYTVSAVGMCGGVYVGRNAQVYVPGAYTLPSMSAGGVASDSCSPSGQLYISIYAGYPPFTFLITSCPPSYTGPLTVTSQSSYYSFAKMPAGTYGVQIIDASQNGTNSTSVVIPQKKFNSSNIAGVYVSNKGCDTLIVIAPYIYGYPSTDTFNFSESISNGILSATPYKPTTSGNIAFKLPPGKTLKDCYGATISCTIIPPCGSPVTVTNTITRPRLSYYYYSPNCRQPFLASVSLNDLVCYPVTFTLKNTATNATYGPYTSATGYVNNISLPYGTNTYKVYGTTSDGYTDSTTFGTSALSANPYSVSVISGQNGLNNYIGGFRFSENGGVSNLLKTVELFSGPAGYSYLGQWRYNSLDVTANASPTATTLKFPPGNYVWKVSDNCGGVYYLPITVAAPDLYQFTVGAPVFAQACNKMVITPTGTATNNGRPVSMWFSLLLNGQPLSGQYGWRVYPYGTPIDLDTPGVYTIIPTAGNTVDYLGYYYFGGSPLGYPNIYTASYTFTYTGTRLSVDLNHTVGFLCKGARAGLGQVYTMGMGGRPFLSNPSPHYHYNIATAGFGYSGPFLASNNTGIFTSFNANANDLYDLKISDSCGDSSIKKVRILDLATTRLISSSKFVSCEYDSIQLSALYLPNATYSWTGPNGFSSTLREPVINPASLLNVGVYHIAVTTTACNGTLYDSTILTTEPAPPKPLVSYACQPRPIAVTITNPSPGFAYAWDANYACSYLSKYYPLCNSDTGYTKYAYYGRITAVVIDTVTGCRNYSDSLFFYNLSKPVIYASHRQLCPGDTVTMVASGMGYSPIQSLQWFFNGKAIPGATGITYTTAVGGQYRLRVRNDTCNVDTSAVITITNVARPVAAITSSVKALCPGDSVLLQSPFDPGYQYTWFLNDIAIPGANASSFKTAVTGKYTLIVANGGCIAASAPLNLASFDPAALYPLLPHDTIVCNPYITFAISISPILEHIRWSSGDTGHLVHVKVPGTYTVTADGPCGPFYDTIRAHLCKPVIHSLTLSDDSICAGNCAVLKADVGEYPKIYHWLCPGGNPSEVFGLPTLQVCYPKAGNYPLTLVVENAGGADTMTNYIVVTPIPEPIFHDTTITVPYSSVIDLPVCGEASSLSWYLGDSLVCLGCRQVQVTAKNYLSQYRCILRNGDCQDSCNYTLRVIDIPHDLWLPDAFTPNGDGRNDYFHIITDNPNIRVVNLDVYNRWGQAVFTSHLNNNGWDGKFKGRPVEMGTYFWQLRY